MPRRLLSLMCLLSLGILCWQAPVVVADNGEQGAEPGQAPAEDAALTERESITQHTVEIDGEEIDYTATAGLIPLREEQQAPKAYVFYIAYTRDGVEDRAARPLTFCFNGGPGSSSVWLHLGAFGPRRVKMPAGPTVPPPAFELVDNDASLLDVTDLVFIDPVSTGFSRAVLGEDPGQFHGVREDVQWVGEFIRLYMTRNNRWGSPKFIAGESYGATRAAYLSGFLQNELGVHLHGVILVSAFLDPEGHNAGPLVDHPFLLTLPTCTATAWYHERLPDDLQERPLREVLDEVEAFALGEYATGLLQGDRLSEAQRDALRAKLSRYTGLPEEYLERIDLRPHTYRVGKELLRDERKVVGRYDSRYTAPDVDPGSDWVHADPSYTAVQGVFTTALNHYVKTELDFAEEMRYQIISDRIRNWNWEYREGPMSWRQPTVPQTLGRSMMWNPHLHVFVANGYYDFATPYFATEHVFAHLGLTREARERVMMKYYAAGHMMYVHEPELYRLKADLAEFYGEALKR